MSDSSLQNLLTDLDVRHERNVPMASLTWYGVGGPAKVLAHPTSIEQLGKLLAGCRTLHIPTYILGDGANLLVLDQGVDGVVIRLDDPAFQQVTYRQHRVTVGAGYDLRKLVLETAKAGLGGLECLAGIPASIGGAIKMNAGGAFGDIGRSVHAIEAMDDAGQAFRMERDDLIFSYRQTNITAKAILQVEFELSPADPGELVKQVKEVFAYKSASQPMRDHSAGCAFKNPPAEVGASAGKLIDQAGLKGYRVGLAEVSAKHANFVVADRGCRPSDILAVIEHVEKTVAEKFGVQLQREVILWPPPPLNQDRCNTRSQTNLSSPPPSLP